MTPAPEKKVGVRRYAAAQRGNGHWSLQEHADGGWMLFSDHEAEVARLVLALEKIRSAVSARAISVPMICGEVYLIASNALNRPQEGGSSDG